MNKNLKSLNFIDPKTKKRLRWINDVLVNDVGRKIGICKEGKLFFLGFKMVDNLSLKKSDDFIDNLKSVSKKVLGKYYHVAIWIFAPIMPRIYWKEGKMYFTHILEKFGGGNKKVLNIGSGNSRYKINTINLDIFPYKEVDIVADATQLPFANNSFDVVINTQLLEHLSKPDRVVSEVFRVLKKNGVVITTAPFIEQFHRSPDDYYRWSYKGLVNLHEEAGFKTHTIVPFAGPTVSLMVMFAEWASLLLSFRINFLYYSWLLIFTFILLPFKLLDLILINYPMAYKISASNLYIGRKS